MIPWSNYRLAAALWRRGFEDHPNVVNAIKRRNPNSVLVEYLKRRKVLPHEKLNGLAQHHKHAPDIYHKTLDVLHEIVMEKFGVVEKNNLTCLQLRTGDVIDYCKNHTVDDHLNNRITTDTCGIYDWAKPVHEYVKPIPYYEIKLSKIDYGSIVVAGGGCDPKKKAENGRSMEYTQKMADHFDAEIVDLNPDKMLHFSMCCKNLVAASATSDYANTLSHLRMIHEEQIL